MDHGFDPSLQQEREMKSSDRELSFAELDAVNAGEVNIVTDKGYIGIEIKVGGYGVAVWATGGSVCGSIITPQNPAGIPGHCIP
jgi:hypothetical protein